MLMEVTDAFSVSTYMLLAVTNDAEMTDAVTSPKVTLLAAEKARPPPFASCAEADARVGLLATLANVT